MSTPPQDSRRDSNRSVRFNFDEGHNSLASYTPLALPGPSTQVVLRSGAAPSPREGNYSIAPRSSDSQVFYDSPSSTSSASSTRPRNLNPFEQEHASIDSMIRGRPNRDDIASRLDDISPLDTLGASHQGDSRRPSDSSEHWELDSSTNALEPVSPPKRVYGATSARDLRFQSKDTLPFDSTSTLSSTRKSSLGPPVPPLAYSQSPPTREPRRPFLRSALRQTQYPAGVHGQELARGQSAYLETGEAPKTDRGVFSNLLKLYGMDDPRRRSQSQMSRATDLTERTDSVDSTFFPTARNYRDNSRCSSQCSEFDALDPDDPRITGARPNTIDQEKHAQDTTESHAALDHKKKRKASITYHISSVLARQTFILRLAKALMLFGSPSHRLESQLKATAIVLEVDAEFVHMPNIVIVSFGDIDTKTSQTHFIKANGVLQLGRLHSVHNLYRSVVHDEIGVEEATAELNRMMKSKPHFGILSSSVLTALCTALICPLAFGGSFIDMLVAGGEGVLLSYLQFSVAKKNAMYANVFEISVSIIMSFIARALSSIPGNLFCYTAISSSGVVLILPGYMILCSALELASKNIVGGSVKLTFAIVYSLFLGFGLTIGSDIYLLFNPAARVAAKALSGGTDGVTITGRFAANNGTNITNFAGTFIFNNATAPVQEVNTVAGCYRPPGIPWYLQPFPLWSLFILVPAFSIFSSAANGQPFRSKQLPIMVVISCASFAANTAANHYIFNRSDVVSAIGAFVAGLLGNLYSRVTKTGTSFTSMVTGILFLVPAGIAATGGLATNVEDQSDQYSNGLLIGLRTVQVAIGITVGLFASSLLIYSFGRSKRGAIFAF